MRASRVLVVMLAALTASGCLRRPAPIQYAYMPPPASGYAAPGQAYPPPAAANAAAAPAPRGFLHRASPSYGAPAYAQPRYQPPAAPPPCTTPGCAGYPAASAYPAAAPGYAAAASASAASGQPAYAYAPPAGYLPGYQLDAGDRLRITVFGQQGLSNSYAVDAAGMIIMPLVGALPARGLTTEQLAQSVAERLRQGYIREPQVAIEIEAYRPFFIHGEVATPGQYPYVANMTVENAVAIAGGFGPRADRSKITVSRSIGGQTAQGAVGLAYPLRPGDILRVGERWF